MLKQDVSWVIQSGNQSFHLLKKISVVVTTRLVKKYNGGPSVGRCCLRQERPICSVKKAFSAGTPRNTGALGRPWSLWLDTQSLIRLEGMSLGLKEEGPSDTCYMGEP